MHLLLLLLVLFALTFSSATTLKKLPTVSRKFTKMSSLSASKSCESNTNTLDSVGVSGGVSFNASAEGTSAQGSPLQLLFGAG